MLPETPSIPDAPSAPVRLENGTMEAEILPGMGAKIWSLRDKRTGTQWIWHNPSVPPRLLPPGSPYDDNWAGGWEELFPNDAPGEFDGRSLPDHGEWWSRAWETRREGGAWAFRHESGLTRTACVKRVSLHPSEPVLTVGYEIRNLDAKALRFLFKQHLAVAATPSHVIELPGGTAVPVDLSFSTRIGSPGPFRWPDAAGPGGRSVDLSRLPEPAERHREFVYVKDLPEGWCGVRDTRTGETLRMTFSTDVFPYVWLFMSFGGWRGLYTVVLEPCTNIPKHLPEAVRSGRCAELAGGGVLRCEVRVSLGGAEAS